MRSLCSSGLHTHQVSVEHLWTNMDQSLIVSNTLMTVWDKEMGQFWMQEEGGPLNNKVQLLEWYTIHPMVIYFHSTR